MNRKKITSGLLGEEEAVKFLLKKKYKIYTTNFTTRFGEIDIICYNKKYIVFVEVKTRSNLQVGIPREFVTLSKQGKIKTTAMIFLSTFKKDLQPRFDIIEVYTENSSEFLVKEINHIENAFQ